MIFLASDNWRMLQLRSLVEISYSGAGTWHRAITPDYKHRWGKIYMLTKYREIACFLTADQKVRGLIPIRAKAILRLFSLPIFTGKIILEVQSC
jgi:hypothetical protein